MWNIKKVVSKGDYNYALVPEHPNATNNGYVLEHRVIMENHLGRLLNANEVVHHIDGNKKNNNILNLELMTREQHTSEHSRQKGHWIAKLKCPWCKKVFYRRKRQTFLSKKNKLNCTCCSRSCSGKFSRYIQLHGETNEMKKAISENLLALYKDYIDEDNSEETDLQQDP